MRLIRYYENGEWKYASVKSVGDLEKLKTTAKEDLVSAINSLIENGGVSSVSDEDIQNINNQIIDLGNRIGAQESVSTSQAETINQLYEDVQTHEESIQEIQETQSTLSQAQGNLEAKQTEIEAQISENKDTIDQVKSDLTGKLDLTTYQQQYNDITSDLQQKADLSEFNGVEGRVTNVEQSVTNIEGTLEQKVSKTDFDGAVGVNKWVSSRYDNIQGIDLHGAPPTFSLIKGMNATEVLEVDDSDILPINAETNQITHFFTNIYLKQAKTISLNVVYDDSLSVFVNGASVFSNKYNTVASAISMSLRAGWNTIEILHGQATGTPVLNLGTKISDQVDKLTSVIGVGDKNETRLTQAETDIKQTSESIELKADKTEVTNLGNRVSQNESALTILNNEISSKVSQETFDNYSKRLEDAESNITQNAEKIDLKVSKTDFDLLNQQVSSQSTEISQMKDSISLKASQEDVNNLNGRVSDAETQIQLNTEAIELKASKQDLDSVTGRVSNAEAQLSVQANEIASKVSSQEYTEKMSDIDTSLGAKANSADVYKKTDVDSKLGNKADSSRVATLETRMTTAETSINQTNNAISLKANSTDVYTKTQVDSSLSGKANASDLQTVESRVTNAESQLNIQAGQIQSKVSQTEFDNLKIGGRNLFLNSDFSNGRSNWNPNGSATLSVIDSADYGHVLKVVTTGGTVSGAMQDVGSKITYNEEYTVSLLMKADAETTVNIQNSSTSWLSCDVTTEWKLFTVTIKPTNSTTIGFFNSSASTFYMAHVQIEKGNKATDYSPAPEDTQSQINSLDGRMSTAESSITQLSDSITLKAEKSDVYTKTETDSKINTSVNNAKSEIKITTDGISQQVSNLSSTVSSQGQTIASHTSSIENLSDSIELKVSKTEFEGLQIGGRNLLLNSGNFSKSNWSSMYVVSTDLPKLNSLASVAKLQNDTATTWWESHYLNGLPLANLNKANTIIGTVYVYVPSTYTFNTGTSLGLYMRQTGGVSKHINIDLTKTDQWQKVTLTFNPDYTLTSKINFFMSCSSKGLFYVTMPKLEVGNKATDYSPAPEDIDSQFNSMGERVSNAESRISQTEKDITLKVSQTDYNGNTMATMITQSPSAIKLIGDNIDLTGKVTFNSFDSSTQTTINNKATQSYVDTKSSTAESNAKSYASSQASSALVNAKTYADSAVDGVKIGGRNYALNTEKILSASGTGGTNQCTSSYNIKSDIANGKGEYVVSFDWKFADGVTFGTNPTFHFQMQGIKDSAGTAHWDGIGGIVYPSPSNISGHATFVGNCPNFNYSSDTFPTQIRMDNINGTVIISNFKVELGNKVTDYSPAPEDTQSFIIASRGYSATGYRYDSGIYDASGNKIYDGGRSYSVAVFDRNNNKFIEKKVFDVFGGTANAQSMATYLNGLGSDRIIIVYTTDEPQGNRLTNGLPDAIYRIGGSRTVFGSKNFQYRSTYVLIGIGGIGEGNGLELYSGSASGDTDAWIETMVTIKNGNIQMGTTKVAKASDLVYDDGKTIEDLKPASKGADVTSQNTAKDVTYVNGTSASTVVTYAQNGNSANTTVNNNKTIWDRANHINSDGTFNTSKLNGTITDAQIASANNWNTMKSRVESWTVSGKTTINGGLIETNTILTKQLAVGDFNNYIDNGTFEDDVLNSTPIGWLSGAGIVVTNPSTTSGTNKNTSSKVLRMQGRSGAGNADTYLDNIIPVKAGDKFFGKMDIKWQDTSMDGSVVLGFRMWSPTKTVMNSWKAIVGSYSPVDWTTFTGTFEVPTDGSVGYVQPYVSYAGASGNKYIWVDNIELRRMTGGELIVDGSITTDKIATGSIEIGKLDSGTQTKINNGNNAQTTINNNKTNWDKASTALDTANAVSNTVNNNKANWDLVNVWKGASENGKTTINGGLLQTGTVLANHLAVGDFTNYAMISEKTGVITPAYNAGVVVSGGYIKSPASNQYLMFTDYMPNSFKAKDQLRLTFTGHSTASDPFNFQLWFYDANKTYITSISGDSDTLTTTDKNFDLELVISSVPSNAVYYVIGLNGVNGGDCYAKNIVVRRMLTGDLIVDGAINGQTINGVTITGSTFNAVGSAGQVTINDAGWYVKDTAGKIRVGIATKPQSWTQGHPSMIWFLDSNQAQVANIGLDDSKQLQIGTGFNLNIGSESGTVSISSGKDVTISQVSAIDFKSGGYLEMANNEIKHVNNITINDAGGHEGIKWFSQSDNSVVTWEIFSSPDDASNADGALQFFWKGERQATIGTTGNIYSNKGCFRIQGASGEFQVEGNAILKDLNSGAFIDVGKDSTSIRLYTGSSLVYDRTYSGSSNMYVTSSGVIGRVTSARKYKLDEQPITNDPKKILNLTPKTWYDKTAVEKYSELLTREANGEIIDWDKEDVQYLERSAGLIAEDVIDVGLPEYVVYGRPDENGNREVEGLEYDRLWTLLIPISKEHEEQIKILNEQNENLIIKNADLEQRVIELEQKLSQLCLTLNINL